MNALALPDQKITAPDKHAGTRKGASESRESRKDSSPGPGSARRASNAGEPQDEQAWRDPEDIKPLTDWENPPTIRDLKQDLTDAQPIHTSQRGRIAEWLDNLNVTGKAKVKSAPGNSQIVPRLIRKQAEWRYAALSEPFLSTKGIFKVSPVTWEDKAAAEQNQLVLNHQFNVHIDKVRFIDEYVRAAVDEGTVIVRVGWEFEEEEYEAQEPVVQFRPNHEMGEMHQQLAQQRQANPASWETIPPEMKQAHEMTMSSQVPMEPVVTGEQTVTRTRTVYNRPTLEVCDYRNVIIDPTCQGRMDKCNFVIYSFESSLSDLKRDGKYHNLDRIKAESASPLGTPDHASSDGTYNFQFTDESRKKIVVYEYWGYWDYDKTGITRPFVGAWVGDTMIRLEANPYPDKSLPFVVEQYLPVRKETYGEPDGALLEDNQKVIGAVTRGMIDIMGKSANGQTGIRKDMLDSTNRRRYDKGLDYEFNQQVDPRAGVYMHAYPEIPNSATFMVQLQNMEAESLTGVKSYSSGVSGASLGDVAAGVRGALDAASKRELGILRRLSNGVVAVGRKMISMNSEFLSDEEVVRVTNDEFVRVRKDDLPGNFDLELTISTAEEDDNKAEQLAFLLQTVGPNSDPEVMKMILSDIARLRKMPDLAHKIENYAPQPDPMQVKKAELEIALLEAQVANEQAKANENNANAALDHAKAGTEQAKAKQLNSDSDLKDLDYLEQESGVKQERDLQKQGEQARAQGELKRMDHEFKQSEKNEQAEQEAVKQRADLLKDYISKAKP